MHKLCFLSVILALLTFASPQPLAAEVSGNHIDPTKDFGPNASYQFIADTTLGWKTGEQTGDINLNTHNLIIETGGGNRTLLAGQITGTGKIEWRGGSIPQAGPSILAGHNPNTFTGPFILTQGVLDLNKPAGVDAIPHELVIGEKEAALVRLDNADQINDSATVTFAGKSISGLDLQSHNEKFASLNLKTHATITMGDKPAWLIIGNCSEQKWDLTKTLTIHTFKPKTDKLLFGTSAAALTREQLARIGFDNPADLPPGLYSARITADGALAPDHLVTAVNPPFDLSQEAIAQRTKLYEIPGLANLTADSTPLKDNTTIEFFGDSITWLNGYIATMEKSIKTAKATSKLHIKLINRGINGGGVLQLRDGAKEAGYPGNTPQAPFAQLIASDKADIAVVYIGINDVWWRKTPPETFEKAMNDLVVAAKKNKTRLVIATLAVHGEFPNGQNPDDKKIEQFAQITRKVAKETGTTLVDLRAAYIAYLQNQNAQLRVDGTLYYKPANVLTYDGVHPNAKGTQLLANLLSDGIVRALSAQ